MAVLCINLSGSNAVIRDINRAKDELENILKDLNKAQDDVSNSIYINGLSSYKSSIESEKLSVQRDIEKLANFSKAYKSFLENAERIDKQYAKIISNVGYDYRNETGLIKEEWKKAGKLIIGTLVIAGTVAAAVFILQPIIIGAAVGACVSAAIGAGTGYLTGGAEGAIDGFFYGSISGAITGAIGGLVAGPPPALGSAPKEVLKYMAKQSIADGVGEGLAGGTVGYMKGGTEGAVAGGVSGLVSGTVTGLISGGISYKAQGLPQKIINKFKDGKLDGDVNIDTKTSYVKSSNIIENKFLDEALPSDGKILNHFIDDGKIKGINGQRRVDFVINKDGDLVLGKKHQMLGNTDDVMAAGQLKIDGQGMIRRIDNGSGHYRPTIEEALIYPELFENAGFNLDKAWLDLDEFKVDFNGNVIDSKNMVHKKIK